MDTASEIVPDLFRASPCPQPRVGLYTMVFVQGLASRVVGN